MDLSNFRPKSDVLQVFLRDSNGDFIPKDDTTNMSITLHAVHSKEYKQVQHELANKRLQKAQKAKRLNITSEEIEGDAIERLVRVTKSWDIILDGKCPTFDYKTVEEVYTSFSWIMDQLSEAIEESVSFTRA